jgi:hypothetical protein
MSKTALTKTALILAATLTLAVPAAAETLKPLHGASLDFGDVTGIAYYVPGAEGDRVVVTLARPDGIRPVRFETLLSGEQRVSMSVPAEFGSGADGIEIRRAGGRISVVPLVRTATAR